MSLSDPIPPPLSVAAEPLGPTTFLVIDFVLERREPAYSVVSAPTEAKAREIAEAAARSSGCVVVDVLNSARVGALLERARRHPPDLRREG